MIGDYRTPLLPKAPQKEAQKTIYVNREWRLSYPPVAKSAIKESTQNYSR
jgi:hypothetical protein